MRVKPDNYGCGISGAPPAPRAPAHACGRGASLWPFAPIAASAFPNRGARPRAPANSPISPAARTRRPGPGNTSRRTTSHALSHKHTRPAAPHLTPPQTPSARRPWPSASIPPTRCANKGISGPSANSVLSCGIAATLDLVRPGVQSSLRRLRKPCLRCRAFTCCFLEPGHDVAGSSDVTCCAFSIARTARWIPPRMRPMRGRR